MIIIKLQYLCIDSPDGLGKSVLPNRLVPGNVEQGVQSREIIEWSGPVVSSGMAETVIEWIATIDTASLITGTVSSLIANYIWQLITSGRKQADEQESEVKAVPSFTRAAAVKIVVMKQTTFVEIDAITVSLETLSNTLEKVLRDGKN